MKPRSTFILAVILLMLGGAKMSAQPLSPEELEAQPVYTTLESALENPQQVYRLRLRINSDSLPDEVFQLTNLQELVAIRCRLNVLNQRIGELANLETLNLTGNHLVKLPETIGNLLNLKNLIISRNIIEALPESISNLHKLVLIDAWENPIYTLPESISELRETLKTIDLRQIDLRDWELEKMEEQLPHTEILYTSTCDCHSTRGK